MLADWYDRAQREGYSPEFLEILRKPSWALTENDRAWVKQAIGAMRWHDWRKEQDAVEAAKGAA